MPSEDELPWKWVEVKGSAGYKAYEVLHDENAQHALFYLKDIEKNKIQVFISLGNAKLGYLPNFNLPARSFILNGKRIVTCPGASLQCRRVCYAQKGAYLQSKDIPIEYGVNYLASLRDDFVETMVKLIPEKEEETRNLWDQHYHRKPDVTLFRPHVSGDFYSPEYAKKWKEIAEKLPDVYFYAYTRAWVRFTDDAAVADIGMTADEVNELNAKIMDVLKDVTQMENFQILLSTDKETGKIPEEYFAMGFKEAGIDFTYAKTKQGRKDTQCPYQTSWASHVKPGMTDKEIHELINKGQIMTCDRCGFCWKKDKLEWNVFFTEH